MTNETDEVLTNGQIEEDYKNTDELEAQIKSLKRKTASPEPTGSNKRAKINQQTDEKYNPYIHGVSSKILAGWRNKGDFSLKSAVQCVRDGHAPLSGELNGGGLVGNQTFECNPCFGRIVPEKSGSYDFKRVKSYAYEKHGSTSKDNPEQDLADLYCDGTQGLTDINLLLVFLTRAKQMGINPNLGLLPISEGKRIPVTEHFKLNIQLHYFYQCLGNKIFFDSSISNKLNPKLLPAFQFAIGSAFKPSKLKSFIHQESLHFDTLLDSGNDSQIETLCQKLQNHFLNTVNENAKVTYSMIIKKQRFEKLAAELLSSDTYQLFKSTACEEDYAFNTINLIVSDTIEQAKQHVSDTIKQATQHVSDTIQQEIQHFKFLARYYFILTADNVYTLDVAAKKIINITNISSIQLGHMKNMIALFSKDKDYGLKTQVSDSLVHYESLSAGAIADINFENKFFVVKPFTYDENLKAARMLIENPDSRFVGDISQVLYQLDQNFLSSSYLRTTAKKQDETIGVLKEKYKLFDEILNQDASAFELTQEQKSILENTFPMILVMEDDNCVAAVENSNEEEYRAKHSSIGVGHDQPINIIATDSIENQDKLCAFFKQSKKRCHIVSFKDLKHADAQGPESKVTHRDGIPKLRWLAFNQMRTENPELQISEVYEKIKPKTVKAESEPKKKGFYTIA